MTVRVRFAPSPTGKIHIGNVRTAVIVWLFGRHNKGDFLLRIDDTDIERSKEEHVDALMRDLTWLGMTWDEFARQKDRGDIYAKHIAHLKSTGRLYPCYETAEELNLKRKVMLAQGQPPIYDRAALKLTADQKAKFEEEGRKPHWRFLLEHKPIEWNDLVRGPQKFEGKDLSDPVLIREDGSPLYHICSVIDDVDFKISHIVRGEDHVTNSATHIQMFEALNAPVPQFAHLALVADAEGGKLSKRLGALSVEALREEEGLEPMSIISLLARLGTSQPIEAYTSPDEVIKNFSFSHFSRNMAKFDPDDLTRLNAKIIHETPYADIKDRLAALGLQEVTEEFWNAVRGNLEKFVDLKEWWNVARGPIAGQASDPAYLADALSVMPATPWDHTTWAEWTKRIKEKTGRKGKELFMPLRQALTGMDHGPELDRLLPLIGPDKVRERLGNAKAA